MGLGDIITGLISLLISVCLVATSAIGIQCMNDNKDYGTKKNTNKQFLIFTVVCGVLGIIASLVGMYLDFKS